jgi:hypothetical protein
LLRWGSLYLVLPNLHPDAKQMINWPFVPGHLVPPPSSCCGPNLINFFGISKVREELISRKEQETNNSITHYPFLIRLTWARKKRWMCRPILALCLPSPPDLATCHWRLLPLLLTRLWLPPLPWPDKAHEVGMKAEVSLDSARLGWLHGRGALDRTRGIIGVVPRGRRWWSRPSARAGARLSGFDCSRGSRFSLKWLDEFSWMCIVNMHCEWTQNWLSFFRKIFWGQRHVV